MFIKLVYTLFHLKKVEVAVFITDPIGFSSKDTVIATSKDTLDCLWPQKLRLFRNILYWERYRVCECKKTKPRCTFRKMGKWKEILKWQQRYGSPGSPGEIWIFRYLWRATSPTKLFPQLSQYHFWQYYSCKMAQDVQS